MSLCDCKSLEGAHERDVYCVDPPTPAERVAGLVLGVLDALPDDDRAAVWWALLEKAPKVAGPWTVGDPGRGEVYLRRNGPDGKCVAQAYVSDATYKFGASWTAETHDGWQKGYREVVTVAAAQAAADSALETGGWLLAGGKVKP